MDSLAHREHSVAELRDKLLQRGAAADQTGSVLEQLAMEGLLSDARFSEAFVRMHKGRGHGPLRVLRELELRGIDAELAAASVDARGEHWCELASHWRQRRFGEALPRSAEQWQREARYLLQRGFSSEQIRVALRGSEPGTEACGGE